MVQNGVRVLMFRVARVSPEQPCISPAMCVTLASGGLSVSVVIVCACVPCVGASCSLWSIVGLFYSAVGVGACIVCVIVFMLVCSQSMRLD